MLISWARTAGQPFTKGVVSVVDALGWPRDYTSWLMACIAFESAETFSPTITNKAGSGAVGLIQFMPATARGLGTTTADMLAMSAGEQLTYVQRYFAPYAARVRSLADMYMAILMPKYVGSPGDVSIFSNGAAYRENSGLDANKDGKVTKDEAVDHVRAKMVEGFQYANVGDYIP